MKREFNLIEIITTTVIVFILLVISFLSYLLFIKDSRNTIRLSDVNKIKESIETSLKISGVLPAPSDGVPITYLSGAIWIQGTLGDFVISKLSKGLDKKVVDPLTGNEYTYSLLNNNKEYQVRTMYEYEEKSVFNGISKTFAMDEYSIVRGNFNGYLASVNKNNIIYVLSIPSIVINNLDDTSLSNIESNKKYIYDYNLGYNGFVPEKLELFSGSLDEFKDISNKAIFLNNYKQSYKNFPNKDRILLNLDKFNISKDNYDSDLDDIANNLLLRTVKDIPNKEFFLENEKRFVIDNFILDRVYEEVGEDKRNFQDRWWINSGAFFNVKDGMGSTVQGELEKGSKRQRDYEEYKGGLDTDKGFHPQNLFRLILNKKFKNFEQYVYFKINKYILSNSENRYESNGFLLFNRYLDSDNLYYTGIRVDGSIIIKKKYKSNYSTLVSKKIFAGTYNRSTNPNLLPTNKWIGVKSEVKNLETGGVSIKVYTDLNNDGVWESALSFVDKTSTAIKTSGYTGIRTDFMDVEIDKYNARELNSGTVVQSGTIIQSLLVIQSGTSTQSGTLVQSGTSTLTQVVTNSVTDNFETDKLYEEIREAKRNFGDKWRLNSGAFFNVKNGVGSSLQGALPKGSKWQIKYAAHNGGLDTDGGYYPQNLFRLVGNKKFQDYTQTAYYKINKYNLSDSPNRFESNGIYLFNRYVDQYNLYYTGIRVDGSIIIKKKYKSNYSTLVSKKIFAGTYNRSTNPNLLPTNKWIGVKSEVKNLETGGVSIKVYTDLNNDGVWESALSFVDKTSTAIKTSGYTGIRTDFMDVEIDKYNAREL